MTDGIAEIRAEGRRLWADYSESDETGVTRDEWERWWYFHADVLLADPSPKCRRIGGPVTLAQSLHMVQPGQEIPKLVFDVCEQVLERFTVCVPAPAPADVLLADPAPVGLSQAGYTDEAIGPNEARMIAMNERLVKERDELRAEVDRLSAAPVGLTEDERELVDRVLANEEDPEYEKSAIIDIFAVEALHKVFDGPTVQKIRHARYVMARRASDMVSDRFRLAQALDRLSAAPVDDLEAYIDLALIRWVPGDDAGLARHIAESIHPRLVPVSPSVALEEP